MGTGPGRRTCWGIFWANRLNILAHETINNGVRYYRKVKLKQTVKLCQGNLPRAYAFSIWPWGMRRVRSRGKLLSLDWLAQLMVSAAVYLKVKALRAAVRHCE